MNHDVEPDSAPGTGDSTPFILDGRLGALVNWIVGRASSALGHGESLLALQRGLLGHYFLLEEAERRLSRQVRLRRGGGTIRQVELERLRLSRELHTGVGQLLAAIRLQVEMIGTQSRARRHRRVKRWSGSPGWPRTPWSRCAGSR